MILVSACLMGENCKYSGGNNASPQLIAYLQDKEYVMVCPEQLGGLPTPRLSSEIVNGRVMNTAGEDVHEAFLKGAEKTLEIAVKHQCELCILQDRSPSCGVGRVYDGTFQKRLIEGDGITAQRLKEHGFKVIGSEEFIALIGK